MIDILRSKFIKKMPKLELWAEEVAERGEVAVVAAILTVVVGGLLLLDAGAPAGPLPGVAMADWWRRRRVVVVAVDDDDDSSFVAAPAALREAPQGGALALPRHL